MSRCSPDHHQSGAGFWQRFRQRFRQQIDIADREAKPHGVDGTIVSCEFGNIISGWKTLHPERIGKLLPVVGHTELFPIFGHAGIVHILAQLFIIIWGEVAVMHLGHLCLADTERHDTQIDRFHISDIV